MAPRCTRHILQPPGLTVLRTRVASGTTGNGLVKSAPGAPDHASPSRAHGGPGGKRADPEP
eukprot:8680531-Lingulodinium_polyedra.AAC.1